MLLLLAMANTALAASSVSGTVFNDINGDGIQSAGEVGIGPVIIYVDANNNDIRDISEVSMVTNGETGSFVISGLTSGTYTIRIQLTPTLDGAAVTIPPTMERTITVATDQAVSGVNFGFRLLANDVGGSTTDPVDDGLPVTGQGWLWELIAVTVVTAGLWLASKKIKVLA